MARTHAVQPNRQSTSRFHQDDGIVLGKGGEPIPTSPMRGITALHPHGAPIVTSPVMHMDDGEIVPPAPKPEAAAPVEYEFVCDKTTWQRNMDGWQALHLLNAMMKQMLGQELSCVLTEAEARQLPSDTRWHFRKRVRQVPSDDQEGAAS